MQNPFHCFRGKSVESNDPDYSSIISFTTLIQRKYVQTNRLCQVYYVCPVEAISPGHLMDIFYLLNIQNMNCKKLSKALLFLLTTLVIVSCSKDDCDLDHIDKLQGLPALKAGTFPEEDLTLNVGEQYVYAPKASSPLDIYYQWYQNGEDMSTDPSFTFNAEHPSRSKVILELSNDLGKVTLENKVIVPGADYSKGCLIINEGWFGHESGSISFYNYEKNSIEHWCYKNQNFGDVLGVTSQSATLWNGKLYVCSKEDNQLVVMDPKTLYAENSCGKLANYQAYEFIGLNDDYGVITHGGYFSRVNLKTFETITLVSVGNTYTGTGSGIAYNGKLILNVNSSAWGSPKVYTIDIAELCSPDLKPTDKVAFQELDIATYGGTRFVQCKDGNIYTVETTKNGKNNLVRIKADFSLEKVAMRDDYSPSSFGAYREASFCGTPDGTFYYLAGGKIYKATFDNPAPQEALTDYTKEGYGFYGAGIRVNPKTNELLAMYLTGDYQKNLLVRFNAATGEKISEIAYDGYYFPATFIFN